jgi:chromosome partitioning protein
MIVAIANQKGGVVLDCPPSLDLLTVSTLVAADAVLIPTVPRILDSRGIELLLQTVARLKQTIHPALSVLGVALVQCEPRLTDTRDVVAVLRATGLPLLKPTVRRAAVIAGAVRSGTPAVLLSRRSEAANDYWSLSREVSKRAKAIGG